MSKHERALTALVNTIEATGGLIDDPQGGGFVPAGDEDWLDLADAYVLACDALGRKPKIQQE